MFCDSEDSTLNSEANEAVSVMTLTQAVLGGTDTATDEESFASDDLRLFLLQVRERRVVIADETSGMVINMMFLLFLSKYISLFHLAGRSIFPLSAQLL